MIGPYCSQCGEKRITRQDYSLRHVVEEVLGEFAHFDTKFLRTLKVLLAKPGELSYAYFHGGRSRYTKPLTLFVIINVVVFLVQPHTPLWHNKYADFMQKRPYSGVLSAHLAHTKEPAESYGPRFNANLQDQKKALAIVLVPLLAILMTPLFIGSHRTFAEHLVFSVQVCAFLLIYLAAVMIALLALGTLLDKLGSVGLPVARLLYRFVWVGVVALIAGPATYMYKGLQRAYDASRTRAALAAVVLAGALVILMGYYQDFLFYVTLWTT
jgi:hypothetical protein